ncbi:hypothetical protein V2A60_004402 [Cordyceps javanica]|uniref:Uncharacterized protein n=1 Tax=Cordyceps javanica TaxID=43265 RepID=A0A545VQV5_9HYPO|nr:hypothetical protein IF1G_09175 [Cordyceps javanica]TQW04110.1 hypothetical protein IF2G_08424 [Cordyceps javanica]
MKDDVPPPYQAKPNDDVWDDPVVEPTIFVLAGQSIHTETTDSPPAYELSRAVATLSNSTDKVELERVDQIIGAPPAEDGAPTVRRRRRHLYDLRHSTKQPNVFFVRSPSDPDAPEYYIHSQSSRRTLGHFGLTKVRSHGGGGGGFRVMPVHVPAASATTSRVRFAQDAAPLFELRRSGDRSQWVAAAAAAAAPVVGDETVAIEDAADQQRRLILMKALPRKEVDVLVAMWCCSIWQESATRINEERREIKGNSFMNAVDTGRGIFLGKNIY